MENSTAKYCHLGAAVSLIGLIVLCVLWETLLAPLRPGGSWLVLKVIPLLLPLRGVIKRDVYTLQWSSMLILIYMTEGLVRVYSDQGLSATLAGIEVALVSVFFFCSLAYLRPYKKAAKQLAKQTIQKASGMRHE